MLRCFELLSSNSPLLNDGNVTGSDVKGAGIKYLYYFFIMAAG
jgi:hypothetical protein